MFLYLDCSLVKVTAAKLENKLIKVDCEVLIPGRYLRTFNLSGVRNDIDTGNIRISVEDDSNKVELVKEIRCDKSYKLTEDLWRQARNEVINLVHK